jgi:transcription elongation factor GreA
MEAYDLKAEITTAAAEAFQEGSPEPFQSLDRLLDAVEETRQMQGLAEISGGALSVQPVQPATYYLHGFALARLGRLEEAAKVLCSLCGKMEQGGRWDILALLLPKVLEAAPSVDAARTLAKLGETAGIDKVDPESLTRAYGLYPDEERLAYLMGERSAASGDLDRALDYWAESLDGFVGLRRYDRLEEALLKVAESNKPEHQRHVLGALHRLGDQNQWGRIGTFIDLALPGLRGAGLMNDLWRLVLHFFPKAPEEAGLRKWIRTLAPEAFPAAEGILDLLGRSGILDQQIRTELSIKQLETLLEFAPGFHIIHASWGIGRVRLNDGDTLVLDFRETKNHRMKLSLARRALTVLPKDDLRVVQAEEPQELKRMLRESPGEIIVRVLRTSRGEASTQDLRRTLVGQGIIATSSWSSFWKEARAGLENDYRVDLTQSFRQVYRLRTEGDEDDLLPLPIIEPRRGIRPNLNLIRRFLEQHPEESARASRTYTPILERWARDEKTSPEDRVAVHLQLHRWRGETREDLVAALDGCLDTSVEMSSFSDSRDQELLAGIALRSPDLWKKGILFVLSSRDAEIRELARERMGQDPEESKSVLIELLRDPSERPQAALAVLELTLEDPREPFAPGPWIAALGATLLVDTASKEPLRKQALTWLSVAGPLAEKLRTMEPEPGNAERWSVVLRRWRSSERYLRPVLEFLSATGHSELVGEIRAAHAERTDRILGAAASSAALDYRGHVMTRATYQKLLHERNTLVWELKNTVAKAIQKAREHGDLRENAEYDAAKAKQSDFAQQISELSIRLAQAKLIENLRIPDDEVAPGTEILVEDVITRDKRSIWILGEGDGWLGDNVVSYAAPLGRNLLGKRAGERVSVIGADSVHELLIRSIVRRHPATEEKPEEIEVTEDEIREISGIVDGPDVPAGGAAPLDGVPGN